MAKINGSLQQHRAVAGKGPGIAGFVLGIVGAVSAVSLLLINALRLSYAIPLPNNQCAHIGPGLGTNIAAAVILGVLALIFGFSALSKGYRGGKAYVGIVLGFITLIAAVAAVIAAFV